MVANSFMAWSHVWWSSIHCDPSVQITALHFAIDFVQLEVTYFMIALLCIRLSWLAATLARRVGYLTQRVRYPTYIPMRGAHIPFRGSSGLELWSKISWGMCKVWWRVTTFEPRRILWRSAYGQIRLAIGNLSPLHRQKRGLRTLK